MKSEKFEMEESFVDKMNQLKTSMEKQKINEKYGEICMKSEDFGAPIQKVTPKYYSCDQTQQKENLIMELEPEKITFRKLVFS